MKVERSLSRDTTIPWSAVLSMTFCVALLLASEFMPVSLLTPIAQGLGVTAGQTGQAIAISGFFAMMSALIIPTLAGRVNRKYVLVTMAACQLLSLLVMAVTPNFLILMVARTLLGVAVGGFWALATSTIMRLVPDGKVTQALGVMYMGQAIASAFAAPLGSFLGGLIGWRGVFEALVPLVMVNLIWMWIALPSLPSKDRILLRDLGQLLKRKYFLFGMIAMALTFGGAFTMFTYLRPYLEQKAGLNTDQLSLMFLVLGCAGFVGSPIGSRIAENHVLILLKMVPAIMGAVTLALLWSGSSEILTAFLLFMWGAANPALSIGWMGWMSQNVKDQPEAAGSLMVAIIQGAILLGSYLGGELLNNTGIPGAFIGSVVLLLMALSVLAQGRRVLLS
ncbi:MFS transporter [Saccharibacter sp. 17.LH.SD]|uniref:MFS transporter n=1 Tax=Saccharibacter sp. 17.LH.SD TaxID=2689393 RepID=UPI00136B6F55|nr:MFS transporter [Saccharibacter sp. 17.LH.SD]MXV44565.1 MFS transporter [Saccharibacter sp. 17.LH.SD]